MKRVYIWIGICLLSIAVALSAVGLWYVNALRHTYTHAAGDTFTVTQGQSTESIIDSLVSAGLVQNKYVALVYVSQRNTVLLHGDFTIPERYTISTLFDVLSHDPTDSTKLTIPEGWTRQQIADALGQYHLSGEKFLSLTKDIEGTLFPDTYEINAKTTEADLVKRMTTQYEKKIAGLGVDKNTLILASIVEREAQKDAQRPIIAGVYSHRLSIGMALNSDPTVQYAKYTDLGKAPIQNGKKNYWAPITTADYRDVKSLYNTYLYNGLPPAPICNPGIKSIEAALAPTKTDASYFITTPDGQVVTSKTLAEHNANVTKYLR